MHPKFQLSQFLQERSMGQQRSHVPYRNSMMTQVLRDSLGGNCRTVMIANITAQHEQLDESISTCRFAQRVAMVSNQVQHSAAPALRGKAASCPSSHSLDACTPPCMHIRMHSTVTQNEWMPECMSVYRACRPKRMFNMRTQTD